MKFITLDGFEQGWKTATWKELRSEESSLPPFLIVATAQGIRLEGHSSVIPSKVVLDQLAQVIGQAWQEHEKLKRQTQLTLVTSH